MLTTDYQDWLAVAASVLTLVLLALSLAAYWATRETRLLLVSLAFALWAFRLGVNALAIIAFPQWEGATWVETEAIILDFITPGLIFLAIVKRKAADDAD